MPIALAPQPGFTFEPLVTLDAWQQALAPHLEQLGFYEMAANVGVPIDGARLAAMHDEGDMQLWRMRPQGGGELSPLFAVYSTFARSQHAYVYGQSRWDNTAVSTGLEAMSCAIFAALPACDDVWTSLPLPHPQDSEETLLIMGFTYTPSALDKTFKRTFGLGRAVWEAYHAAEDAPPAQ